MSEETKRLEAIRDVLEKHWPTKIVRTRSYDALAEVWCDCDKQISNRDYCREWATHVADLVAQIPNTSGGDEVGRGHHE